LWRRPDEPGDPGPATEDESAKNGRNP